MLELKYSHELTWGDLKYLETPRDALRTIERVHGSKFTLESIRNAHRHSLPKFGTHKVHNGYNTIQRSLEDGNAFLVNRQTQSPILRTLELKEGGQEVEWTLRSHVNDMLRNTLRTVIDRVEKPKPMGVHRQAPSQSSQQNNDNQPPEREKHRILLDLKGQNGRPLPDKHNVTIFVENTTQSKRACKQLNDVIHNPFSKRFITEKGDGFKVYVIPSALHPVVDDLKINGNVSQSESEGLISALSETGQETDTDGTILHHFKYEVPNNYIEIELLDEDGNPEARERFKVLDLQGKTLASGRLDEQGYIKIEQLATKDIKVLFPDLDQKSVKPE